MVIDILKTKIKTLQDMNDFRMKCFKQDELVIITLKEALIECEAKGIE